MIRGLDILVPSSQLSPSQTKCVLASLTVTPSPDVSTLKRLQPRMTVERYNKNTHIGARSGFTDKLLPVSSVKFYPNIDEKIGTGMFDRYNLTQIIYIII